MKKQSSFFRNMLLGLILLVSSCGGTGVGNPSANIFLGTASETIVGAICSKLNECFSELTGSACTEGVFAVGNIDTEIGLSKNQYPNLEAVSSAELNGEIGFNQGNLVQCVLDISSLSCSDPSVMNAWNASQPSFFDQVANMIPQNINGCSEVFKLGF